MKKLLYLLVFVLCLLPVSASAFTVKTDTGLILEDITVEEFVALGQQPDDVVGAIVMFEGQRGVTQTFLPDGNNTRDLGEYTNAFKDVYASGTVFADELVARDGDTTLVAGQKLCLADGTNCAGISSDAMWVVSGQYWYMTSTTPVTVGIGTATPTAMLQVAGDADITQFLVVGHSTQNGDLIQAAANSGDVIFNVDASGNVAASGTLAVVGATSITGALTTGGGIVSDTTNTDSLGSATVAWANIYASGTVYADTLKVGLNTGLGGTLTVAGASTLVGNVAITGTLTVTGATTLTGLVTPNGGIATSTWNATTIGISTPAAGGFTTLSATGVASLTGSLHASSTILATGLITPYGGIATSTWDGTTIGLGTRAAGHFSYVSVGSGTASSTLRDGATATSTISSSVLINEAAATSTLELGAGGTKGAGSCIVMASGDGTGVLYLFVNSATLQLATSTNASDCF